MVEALSVLICLRCYRLFIMHGRSCGAYQWGACDPITEKVTVALHLEIVLLYGVLAPLHRRDRNAVAAAAVAVTFAACAEECGKPWCLAPGASQHQPQLRPLLQYLRLATRSQLPDHMLVKK